MPQTYPGGGQMRRCVKQQDESMMEVRRNNIAAIVVVGFDRVYKDILAVCENLFTANSWYSGQLPVQLVFNMLKSKRSVAVMRPIIYSGHSAFLQDLRAALQILCIHKKVHVAHSSQFGFRIVSRGSTAF